MVSRRIEGAQKKVEERNFDVRKSLLDYDEVMDEQRKEMQGSMGMMNQMMQGSTTPGGMGTGMMGQKSKPADAGAQMQMMQKRMDMMQMMMQTMMDQQGMMAVPRAWVLRPRSSNAPFVRSQWT